MLDFHDGMFRRDSCLFLTSVSSLVQISRINATKPTLFSKFYWWRHAVNFRFRFWSCWHLHVVVLYLHIPNFGHIFTQYGDIRILRFNTATVRHIGFFEKVDRETTRLHGYPQQNFHENAVMFKLSIWICCRSRLKVLFMGPKFQFWESDSQNLGDNRSDPQKAHPCAEVEFWELVGPGRTRRVVSLYCTGISHRQKFRQLWGFEVPHQTSQKNPASKRHPFVPSTTTRKLWE